jgi:hypothetical protein
MLYVYKAKLDRVVDGDTIDATIDLGFDTWAFRRIRLAGIDAPETRTRDLVEKQAGFASKFCGLTIKILMILCYRKGMRRFINETYNGKLA